MQARIAGFYLCFRLFRVVPLSSIGVLRLGSLPPPVSLTAVGISSVAVQDLPLVGGMIPDGPPSALPLQSSLFSSGLSDWTLPSTQEGMSLAMSLSPIPARIVQQIRAARYIDMSLMTTWSLGVTLRMFRVCWGCR